MPPPPYDVLVLGAGPAGLAAALQAAHSGSRTLLVEKSSQLGGATTTGGVNFPGLFHAWGRQVIAGYGWDLVRRTVAESGGTLPDFSRHDLPHWQLQIRVDRFTYTALADETVLASGCQVLLHTLPVAFSRQGSPSAWRVTLAGKEGLHEILARTVIDASGDANAVSLAGGRVRRSSLLQPGTLVFRASGYDPDTLDYPALTLAFEHALQHREVLPSDLGAHGPVIESFLRKFGENTLHVTGIDARTSSGKTDADLRARAAALRLQRFFRQQPGLSRFHLAWFAPECGIRETVTIDGLTEVTADDYTSGRLWPDAVCHSFYPIDIHRPDGNGIDIRPLSPGIVPTLPLACMIPRDLPGFLAPGRHACGDQAAHSAFRVQASCFAMGQAAGAAASLACSLHLDQPQAVPLPALRALLAEHGAIVPELSE